LTIETQVYTLGIIPDNGIKIVYQYNSRRWEDNIKMDFQEAGGGGCGDWIELAQDRDRWRALVGTVRDFRLP
jgi:hypothetical protein